jgi:hypothetical protein
MKNPFDSIAEPDKMPNPGFRCKQYIDTHDHAKQHWPKHLCTTQCDACVNEIIEYHKQKLSCAAGEKSLNF